MPVQIDILSLGLIAVLALALIAIIVYALKLRGQGKKDEAMSQAICAAITDYFRKSGVTVDAGAVRLGGSKRFTAIIESEPMKRFRLSHIIEMTLREHVRRTCSLELDKVYWRFPIKEAPKVAGAADAEGEQEADTRPSTADDYINEGLEHYKYVPKVEATEMSWEQFQEIATQSRDKSEETVSDKPPTSAQ